MLYKTWCQSCREKDSRDKDNEADNDDNESNRRKRKTEKDTETPDFMYIGETSRSAKERASEHFKDLQYLRLRSHMLKHAVLHHPDIHPTEVDFRFKILSYHKTAFERQVTEAVMIRRNMGPNLLNSKQEYN